MLSESWTEQDGVKNASSDFRKLPHKHYDLVSENLKEGDNMHNLASDFRDGQYRLPEWVSDFRKEGNIPYSMISENRITQMDQWLERPIFGSGIDRDES